MTLKQFFENKGELGIRLNNKAESKIFSKEANKLGYKWKDGVDYLSTNCWGVYKGDTCYLNDGSFDSVKTCMENKIKILNFEDIEWEN